MGKKRFFDDRLKYLSFIQNTGEKNQYQKRFIPLFQDYLKINLI